MTIYRLTRRVKFPNHWPSVGVDFEKIHRLSPTPYTFENLSDSHFNTAEDLYVGQARWSQVYAGSLVSPSSPSINRLKFDNVVLKIYNPAFFPYPNADPEVEATPPEDTSENSYRYTDELMAWSEVHAYSKLSRLQGKVIPHFIDAFMVKSSNSDEENIGIAMSRIHGKPIIERCQELGSEVDGDTRWYPIAAELIRKIHEIHQLGIIDLDIRGPNIRVVEDSKSGSAAPSVMIYDFAHARPSSFPTEEERLQHCVDFVVRQDMYQLSGTFLDICGDRIGGPRIGHPGNRVRAFLRWAREECSNEPWYLDWWSKHFSGLRIDV